MVNYELQLKLWVCELCFNKADTKQSKAEQLWNVATQWNVSVNYIKKVVSVDKTGEISLSL